MNILILSCGTRNKIVQYFKRTLDGLGMVVATDCSELAPALYDADKYYIVPRITDSDYLNQIFAICTKEKIKGVLSLIDPELSLLAEHKANFEALGITLINSAYEQCERCLDKYAMYQWLTEHGYPCAKSYIDFPTFLSAVERGQMKYPVFVKPTRGSASMSIAKANDRQTAEFLYRQKEGMLIQEYLQGDEIGADVYIDLISHKVVSVFTRKKLAMRAGETDKAVSFKNDRLFDTIVRLAEESGFTGQIDIDIFDRGGKYYISEVNPRFGGGYPHAYECGVDHMRLVLNNLFGKSNESDIGRYEDGIYMMKYSEIILRAYDEMGEKK